MTGMQTYPIGMAGLRNVAVFRALNLGDMLCAMPALRALRHALPQAHITLVGLNSALPILHAFGDYLDELVEFPGDPAFPEQRVRHDALPGFYRAMRARNFDLVVQMHGSGAQSNAIVQAMEPARWVGFVSQEGQAEPGRLLFWPDHLHEVHRYLALLRHVGLDASDDTLEFPVSAADDAEVDALIARFGLEPDRLVFLHPGARLASRRWPLERFRAVAQALASSGWQLAVTGSAGEKAMVGALTGRSGLSIVDVCGMTRLGVLAGLLRRGRLLVCNDTGVSHVAASVHLRSVVIACGSDVTRWRPLDTQRHTVVYDPVACRPCAWDECPVGHPCALNVQVDDVLDAVYDHLFGHAP